MNLSNRYPSLADKVVFITGGASGIGASLVEAFCREQANVAFVDILAEDAHALVDRVASVAGARTPRFLPCDLRDIAALRDAIEGVRDTMGPIGVLINNAASDDRHDFSALTVEDWNDRINVNLRHAFFATQAVFGQMRDAGGGSVINFGSMSWHASQGGMTAYTTSKAGIEGLTRGLARDLGRHNIRINTLVPGWVMTAKQLRERVDAAAAGEIDRNQCLKRPLEPRDIAAMALFLASDDSRMCTAQNFVVDGGWI